MFLSVLGKGGFIKGKTLTRGKQRDQFIVGNSLWPTPGEMGSPPAPIYLFLGQVEGLPVCQNPCPHLPPGPASPEKQNLKTSPWNSSFYPALLQGALGALVLPEPGPAPAWRAQTVTSGLGLQGLTSSWPRGKHSRLNVSAAETEAVPATKAKVPEMTQGTKPALPCALRHGCDDTRGHSVHMQCSHCQRCCASGRAPPS